MNLAVYRVQNESLYNLRSLPHQSAPWRLSEQTMKNSLERRILLFSFLALTLTLAVNTGFNVDSFRRSYRDGILQRAQTFATALKDQVESVVNLGLPLNEIDGVSKHCQQVVKNDPEISYCLVENASGVVLYHNDGVYPETSSVKFLGTLSPDVSILESSIIGKIYDFAIPIYDFNDNVTGRVRIGFSNAVLHQLVLNHLASTVLVLAIAFIVVFSIIVLFSRYDLVLPIRRLCEMASEVASGKFDAKVPEQRTRELAMLGDTLNNMAVSLQERDEQIGRNYQELEQTNLELQISYENLESLSSELGRSREMYRSLLDDASDAILVCNDEDNLVLANKAAECFFGLPRDRMEGRNYFSFLEVINCRDVELQFERHQEVVAGRSGTTEIRFWRSMDRHSVLGRATSTAIVGKNGKKLVQIVVRDVTKEEAVRQGLEKTASEMARLSQMKNSFLGLASHELKTPLTIIMGYVELLQSERDIPLDEDALELVHHISKASDRLSEIIRDMVDVSLLDGNTVELVSQEVDVNALVQRAVDRSEGFIRQREQILTLDLGKDLPLVRCDVDRMVQSLSNILGNAIKFTPDQGTITVRTRLVERPRTPEKFSSDGVDGTCSLSADQTPYIEVSVADTGIGIAESEQEAVFEKFYEIGDVEEHFTEKTAFKGRGAGLGLSIAKGIVDLHGGVLWVESPGFDPEKLPGSTFYVLLPTATPKV